MKYAAGEIIFKEGDESDVAYLITSGKVEIYRGSPTGQMEQLAILEAGQMFGEMGPMDRSPRNASARALADTVLTPMEIEQDEED